MIKKSIIITLISLSILFNGCYSFYGIENKDLSEVNESDVLEIEFNDGTSKVMEGISRVCINSDNDLEILSIDSSKVVYSLGDINRVKIEKFDYPKSFIITPIFSGLAIVSLFLLIVFITGADLSAG